MAAAAVCTAYKRAAVGSAGEEPEAAAAPPAGRPIEGDCPICFDDLQPGGTTPAVSQTPLHTCLCCPTSHLIPFNATPARGPERHIMTNGQQQCPEGDIKRQPTLYKKEGGRERHITCSEW